jgi:hypothetical protein
VARFVLIRKVRKAGSKPVPIERTKLRIGRGGENDLDLDDFLVSPLHCELEWIGGQCRLSDAGSVTGTFVDGKPVEKYFTLTSGQKVTVGLNRLEIAIDLAHEECTITLFENIGTGEKTLHKVAILRPKPWWARVKNQVGAGFLAAAIPLAVALALGRQGMFANGALARPHATTKAGVALGCDACHAPTAGVPAERCAACHEAAVAPGTTHPIATRAVRELGCAACHNEHRGAEARLVPAHVAPADCRACHADAHRTAAPGRRKAKESPRTVEVVFDAFDHAAHVRAGLADCRTCHRDAEKAGPGGRDFARMGYEGCVACHAHRAQAVERHGTNAQCTACHAAPNEKALAFVTEELFRPAPYALGAQHHDLGQKCERCHAGTVEESPPRAPAGTFDHHAHLATLAPADPQEAARVDAQCALCHAGVKTAASVEASRAYPLPSVCARCHTDVRPAGAASAESAGTRTSVRFAHAAHAKVSCLACHPFEADLPGARPRVSGAAADCRACHIPEKKRHVDAGLGSCVYCHRGANDLFEPGPKVAIPAPSIPYSHRSPTHATLACSECHSDASQAARSGALRFPAFESPACERCHGSEAGGGDLDCVRCHSFHHDKLARN